ncbi:MAG: HupE/UreJ family protein, partial [Burkholderiales bacterium]
TIPDRLTGALVAASIAYIAAENLFPKYAIARRWAVSLVFGLVHGFAFARALREIGLPHENLAASLLYFNLGIEAGQAMVVLLIVPILVLMNRKFWEPKLVATISAIVLAVGSLLFFERALIGV